MTLPSSKVKKGSFNIRQELIFPSKIHTELDRPY